MKLWWLKVPVHPTWHFTAWLAGIVAGLALSVTAPAALFGAWQWMMVGAVLFGFSCYKRWRWLLLVAVLAGMLIGMSRGVLDIAARHVYAQHVGHIVTLSGRVSEDVDRGRRGEQVVRLTDIRSGEQQLPAQIWATLEDKAAIQRSDIVTIRGRLGEGFGSFAGSIYRADIIKIERPTPGDVALHVRDDFGWHVRLGIEEPAASLGMGYLTGQRRSLPEDLDVALKIAGLTHIVVASGYNLTILVRFAKRLLEKASRYLTVLVSGIMIASFMAVTGLSPSMTRAGLVAGLALAAWYFGRKFHPVTLLLVAAAATGLVNPSYVWGSLGWQLSFAAFAGVMVVAPLGQAYFFGAKKPGMIRQILGETISAQLATAPLLLYSFGQISNVAVIANALVLPLVPFAMILTFIAGVAGYLTPALAPLVALPAQWLLDYMVYAATTTSSVSWAQSELELPLWGVVLLFAMLAAACWWMWRASGYRLRDGNIIE
ncbi:hypothetical protein CR983_01015 [Candidatus Saccharibacteria bacterium]|nr:MAG: hypothetical protein CR983_01015 [Candidatus Saccharibacteria bacterium]